MPELPEVESYRKFLEKKVQGKTIKNIVLIFPKLIKKPLYFKTFYKTIVNSTIESVRRHGKYLLFILKEHVLIVHLRMEGGFVLQKENNFIPKYCCIYFTFTDEQILYYVDSRKFGTFELENKKDHLKNKGLSKIGLDPFDSKLTPSYLFTNWRKKTMNIKTTLLEQNVIAGIGNIYASEVLFISKINPFQKTNTLTLLQLKNIIFYIKKIFVKAIQMGGTTSKTFKIDNHKGVYFNELKVYGRKNKDCFSCNSQIKWIKINGRGTFYCPQCQK